jgi:O-antigen/teichoic acid export membrane protein
MMVTILAVILRPTLGAMIVSWIIGAVVASIAVLLFGIVREPKPLRRIKPHYEYRTLLLFAIPLALALDLNVLTVQVDTLILGYFRNATQVGLYNAAISLSQIIPVFLIAIGFMFAPVAARLVGEDRERHIPYFYRMATKWLLVFSLPLWLLFVMYPAFSIQIVIGARYHEAALALRILSAGQFIALCFGPAFLTLVAFGRTKLLLINAAFGAASNTILNLILVPRYGINGAAISTATVIAVMGAVMLLEVYIGYRIHPFDVRYFKPFFVTIIVSGLLFWPLRLILQHHHFVLPFYYVLLLAISAGSVFLTRCVDETEMHLLRAAIDRLMSYLRGDSGE